MKRTKIVLLSIIFLVIVISNNVYGSFADYTDEDAASDTEKLIEEHNANFDTNKSSNNYLKSLSIDKGELSPAFDKQINNYNLSVTNDIEEIVISANTEDNKANINGAGKINIKEKKQLNIEVTAESGTVRSYFINIIRPDEENKNNSLNQEDEKIDTEIAEGKNVTEKEQTVEPNNTDNKGSLGYIGVLVGILVIIIIIIILKK